MPQRSTIWTTVAGALALLTMTAACDRSPAGQDDARQQGAEPETATADEAPTPIPITWELTIGGADGAEEGLFHRIADLLPVEDGGVWVLDGEGWPGNQMIRRYDSSGRFQGEVGRVGQGPGEYQDPSGLARLRDGRVLVRDLRSPHIQVYRPDGHHDTTWTFSPPLTAPPHRLAPWGSVIVDDRGVLWVMIVDPAMQRPGPDPPRPERERYVRLRSDGSVVDTVDVPLPDEAVEPFRVTVDGTSHRISVPYRPRSFLALGPSGEFAIGDTGEYAIDILRPPDPGVTFEEWRAEGRVATIRRTTEAIPVGEASREAARAQVQERVAALGASAGIPEVPGVRPPLGSVTFDHAGRLWVRVSMPYRERSGSESPGPDGEVGADEDRYEPLAYDVFGPDRTLLGRIVFPEDRSCGFPRRGVRDDAVWCVSFDGHFTESVDRYRIHWP
jgi:hypothetical protein